MTQQYMSSSYDRTYPHIDKILYDIYTTRTKLIFHTAWEIANMDERIEVDQN